MAFEVIAGSSDVRWRLQARDRWGEVGSRETCQLDRLSADLWKHAAVKLRDHGNDGHEFLKTKAHRSRLQAAESVDDPIWHCFGNDRTDKEAKRCEHQELEEKQRNAEVITWRVERSKWIAHIGYAAAWCFQHWPELVRRRRAEGDMRAWQLTSSNGRELAAFKRSGWRCFDCCALTTAAAGNAES